MVDGMEMPPIPVWCERQDSEKEADEIVGPSRSEKRAVSAVMEDNEKPSVQSCGYHGKGESDPVGDIQAEAHQAPDSYVGNEAVHDLP